VNGHIPGELLSALVDGEVATSEVRVVREHVAGCPDCALALRELESVRNLVSGLPRLKAPEGLVASAIRPVPITSHRRRWVAATAAAAAAVISLAGLVTPAEEAQEPPVEALMTRHVGVDAGTQSSGEVLFAVTVGR